MKFDQNQYLSRIGCSNLKEANIQTLRTLHYNHLMAIPFENLDIHVPIPIVLNIDMIFDKIVGRSRGGFCYELNGLFCELLLSMGFNVKRVSARVMDKEGNYPPEFDHLALLVEIFDEIYLVDVGCGEFILEPLLFELEMSQKDLAGEFIIDRFDGSYRVSKLVDGEIKPEYIFTDIPRALDAFNARCEFQQSDPNSHFKKKRMITRPTPKGRISIAGKQLKITEEGQINEMILEDEGAFQNALKRHFNITLDQ